MLSLTWDRVRARRLSRSHLLQPAPLGKLNDVVLRYAAAYGPITPRHFVNWFHPSKDLVEEIFDDCADQLREVDVEGERAWIRSCDVDEPWESAEESVFLLPRYDCYVLNSLKQTKSRRNEKKSVLPESARKRVFSRGMGRYEGAVGLSNLIIDGRVGGIWKQRNMAKRVENCVEPFVELSKEQIALLEEQIVRIGEFFQKPVDMTIGRLD